METDNTAKGGNFSTKSIGLFVFIFLIAAPSVLVIGIWQLVWSSKHNDISSQVAAVQNAINVWVTTSSTTTTAPPSPPIEDYDYGGKGGQAQPVVYSQSYEAFEQLRLWITFSVSGPEPCGGLQAPPPTKLKLNSSNDTDVFPAGLGFKPYPQRRFVAEISVAEALSLYAPSPPPSPTPPPPGKARHQPPADFAAPPDSPYSNCTIVVSIRSGSETGPVAVNTFVHPDVSDFNFQPSAVDSDRFCPAHLLDCAGMESLNCKYICDNIIQGSYKCSPTVKECAASRPYDNICIKIAADPLTGDWTYDSEHPAPNFGCNVFPSGTIPPPGRFFTVYNIVEEIPQNLTLVIRSSYDPYLELLHQTGGTGTFGEQGIHFADTKSGVIMMCVAIPFLIIWHITWITTCYKVAKVKKPHPKQDPTAGFAFEIGYILQGERVVTTGQEGFQEARYAEALAAMTATLQAANAAAASPRRGPAPLPSAVPEISAPSARPGEVMLTTLIQPMDSSTQPGTTPAVASPDLRSGMVVAPPIIEHQ